jgi:hypothetical protein
MRCGLALASALAATACRPSAAQQGRGGAEADPRATAAAAEAMSHGGMEMDPHMRMTTPRRATAADSARAAALVRSMRAELARFRDVHAAEAAGFEQFLPNVPQPVYHFTNWRWAVEEAFRFDPAKPTSLLYRREPDGRFTLVGAMYTAPRRFSEDRLGERIPLGIARWHQHVSWCLPPRGQAERWREMRGGEPVFGPRSPIATKAECDAVGGVFHEHLFGWMVHVNAFESDDPKVVWADHHGASAADSSTDPTMMQMPAGHHHV